MQQLFSQNQWCCIIVIFKSCQLPGRSRSQVKPLKMKGDGIYVWFWFSALKWNNDVKTYLLRWKLKGSAAPTFSSFSVYNHMWEQWVRKHDSVIHLVSDAPIIHRMLSRMCWAYPEHHSLLHTKSFNLNSASYTFLLQCLYFYNTLILLIYSKLDYTVCKQHEIMYAQDYTAFSVQKDVIRIL